MKKSRPDKCQPHAITLSSKRGSANQEQLFVPYKIDWKNSPLQTVENNSSRAFFQNMKAELSNIKNDFQKLIKKEGPTIEKDEDFKSASKPKCQSAYKKDVKKVVFDKYPENEKLDIVMNNNREDNDHFFKILNLQKNLPCSSGPDYKNSYSKTINIKDYIAKESKTTSPFEAIDIQRNQRAQSSRGERLIIPENTKIQEKQKEILNLKEIINTLQIQLKETKDQRDFTHHEVQRLFTDNNNLVTKINDVTYELSSKLELVLQQEAKIQKLSQDLRIVSEKNQQANNMEQQFNNERNFYNEKINQLMFHNQNLGVINMQLGEENQMLKENCSNLQRFIGELQMRGESMNAENKRKLEYIQRDIQQYQKREDMFSREIEKLNLELMQAQDSKRTASEVVSDNQSTSNLTRDEEILELKDEIRHLTIQVNIQKEIHTALSKKYEEQIASLKIQELSHQFQEKINKLVDENGKLKSKLNFCQSSLQSMNEQNQSYLMQISLYEQRDKTQASKQLTSSEWEELTQQIERLREENKRLCDEIEYKGLKLESEQTTPQLPTASCDSLIRMANMQLFENERLKETIKELSTSLKSAEQKIQSLTLIHLNEISPSINPTQMTKHLQQLKTQISAKSNQINGLKELIFKVLIQKVNKLEDEEELQYYLKEVELKRQLLKQ